MSESEIACLTPEVLARLEAWALDGGEVPFDDLRRTLPDLIAAARESTPAPTEALANAWDAGLDAGRERWMDSREFGDPPRNPHRDAARTAPTPTEATEVAARREWGKSPTMDPRVANALSDTRTSEVAAIKSEALREAATRLDRYDDRTSRQVAKWLRDVAETQRWKAMCTTAARTAPASEGDASEWPFDRRMSWANPCADRIEGGA